ncbi:hypothetical protein STAS_17245 [Striga asiatica]|uniref:B3 domain-containing protein n=1 Tax=Striga asiatica TaxID=4170 RepID=A0A5A7Q662_STRAF|nr:hypothetical protein STAS_17245 [Striga asiatica]
MASQSRVLPLPTYRDPNYDSDTSFENYYLNYAEEQQQNNRQTEGPEKNEIIDDTATSTPSGKKRRSAATPDNSLSPQSTVTETTQLQNGGPVLFARRVLRASDLNKKQHRLSLPCKQVMTSSLHKVFTETEIESLKRGKAVGTKLVDPAGDSHDGNVRLTQSGPTSYCYAVGKPWVRIVEKNGFGEGMVLQVRADREEETGKLRFILERGE